MKKLLLTLCAAGLSVGCFAQGVIYFDGSNNSSTSPTATSEGSVFFNTNGTPILDVGSDVNAVLLASANSDLSSDVTIVTLLLSQATSTTTTSLGTTQSAIGDVTSYGTGILIDTSGNSYQIPSTSSGQTYYFEVLAWTGNYSTYSAAQSGALGTLAGSSGIFSEVLTSATGEANDIEGMPALVLSPVPEPTTLAIAALGGLSLLGLRRKKA